LLVGSVVPDPSPVVLVVAAVVSVVPPEVVVLSPSSVQAATSIIIASGASSQRLSVIKTSWSANCQATNLVEKPGCPSSRLV
jgi:hypothetical protein